MQQKNKKKLVICAMVAIISAVMVIISFDRGVFSYGTAEYYPEIRDTYELVPLTSGASLSQEFRAFSTHLKGLSFYIINSQDAEGEFAVKVSGAKGKELVCSVPLKDIKNASWTTVYLGRYSGKQGFFVGKGSNYTVTITAEGVSDDDPPMFIVIPEQDCGENMRGLFLNGEPADGGSFLAVIESSNETQYVKLFLCLMAVIAAAALFHVGPVPENTQAGKIAGALLLTLNYALSLPNPVYKLTFLDLDPSWRYFLNIANSEGYVFGKNVFFTYGPLGYLCYLMNLGDKWYIIGICLWLFIFGLHAVLVFFLFRLFRKGRIELSAVLISTLCFLALFRQSESDNYLLYVLLLAFVAWDRGEKKAAFISNALLVIMFFCKFSTFSGGLAFACFFVLWRFVFCRDGRACLMIAPAIPAVVLGYLLYNPSIKNLIDYVGGIFRISSGWMKTQQWDDVYTHTQYVELLIIIAAYLILLAAGIAVNRQKMAVGFAVLPSLFLAYKYGSGAHGMVPSIWLTSMIFSAAFLSFPFRDLADRTISKVRIGEFPAFFLCFIITLLQAVNLHPAGSWIRESIQGKLYTLTHLSDSAVTGELRANTVLPESFLQEIGNSTVTSYPWETGYKSVYPELNVVYSPSVQNCNVFIPWLDTKVAEYYCSEDAPEYILMKQGVIYNHVAGLENPLMWMAIKSRYEVAGQDEGMLLLKHRSGKEIPENALIDNLLAFSPGEEESALKLLRSDSWSGKERIICPEGAQYCIVHMSMSLKGKIIDFLDHAGMMWVNITYDDGSSAYGTVVIPNLDSGIELSFYPQTLQEVTEALNGTAMKRITSFQFSGKAADCYEDGIQIDWYSVK